MKYFYHIIFMLAICGSLHSQDVPEVQTPIVTKITATWCSNCGSWGWQFFEDALEDNNSNSILIAAHPSGNLQSFEGQDLATNFSALGQPKFYLNNTDFGVNSVNLSSKRQELLNEISTLSNQSPVANTGLTVTRDGNTLSATSKTKFFQPASGNFFLSIFILEDHVIENQSNQGPNADHRRVLRGSFEGNTFGSSIAQGEIAEDMEFDETFSTQIGSTWNADNLYFVAVLWEEVDGKYVYVNANQVQETTVSSTNLAAENGFDFSWVSSDQDLSFKINSQESGQTGNIRLYDLNGIEVWNTTFLSQKGSIWITTPSERLSTGAYVATLELNGSKQSLIAIK